MSVHSELSNLITSLEKVIFGKRKVIELSLCAILARGHLLIEDAPGMGKTRLADALAQTLGLSFRRLQFTSDLLPSDIVGTAVYFPSKEEFSFKPGPIFSNVILADELNRTPPKTQSCLLEAMNDGRITVDGTTYPLPEPFFVVATQNPAEFYGTYPLPESQLDRFLLRVEMGYPDKASEKKILEDPRSGGSHPVCEQHLGAGQLSKMQQEVEKVRMEQSLVSYILQLVEATRRDNRVHLGLSPRAARGIYRCAQAHAFLYGSSFCVPDDIKGVFLPASVHRIVLSEHSAQISSRTAIQAKTEILSGILSGTPVPR